MLYENRLDDIDATLSAGLKYGGLPIADVLAAVESVDVYLYWDIPNTAIPFVCPSGPGEKPGDIDSRFGNVFRYRIDASKMLTVIKRQ